MLLLKSPTTAGNAGAQSVLPKTAPCLIKIYVKFLLCKFRLFMLSLWSHAQTEITFCLVTAGAQRPLYIWQCAPVFGTHCVFLSVLAPFPNSFAPQRVLCACWVTWWTSPLVLHRGYGVQGWARPYWVFRSLDSAVIGHFHPSPYWLRAVARDPILYHTANMTVITLKLKFSVLLEDFPSNVSPSSFFFNCVADCWAGWLLFLAQGFGVCVHVNCHEGKVISLVRYRMVNESEGSWMFFVTVWDIHRLVLRGF